MKNLLLALGLATVLFTSCNKEDLPTPGDRCGAGQVTQVGIKKDESVGPGDRFDYYVWFIDDCTGELLRDEIDQGEFNSIEVGDYYTK